MYMHGYEELNTYIQGKINMSLRSGNFNWKNLKLCHLQKLPATYSTSLTSGV